MTRKMAVKLVAIVLRSRFQIVPIVPPCPKSSVGQITAVFSRVYNGKIRENPVFLKKSATAPQFDGCCQYTNRGWHKVAEIKPLGRKILVRWSGAKHDRIHFVIPAADQEVLSVRRPVEAVDEITLDFKYFCRRRVFFHLFSVDCGSFGGE